MAVGMTSRDWLKIQKNWEYLKQKLEPLEVIEKLRECEVEILTLEDYQRVKYEPVDADKVEKLLHILKFKPPGFRCYKRLIAALRGNQDNVADRLEKTDISPEEVKDEPSHNEEALVREVLLETFVDEPGESVTLPAVREAVQVIRARCLNFDWNDSRLIDFVKEVFSGVKYEKGSGKRKIPKFLNLGLKNKTPIVPRVCKLPEGAVGGGPQVTPEVMDERDDTPEKEEGSQFCLLDIESLDTDQLYSLLEPIFIKLKLDESFTMHFKTLDIDGEVLVMMTEEDYEKQFTSDQISFGKRKKLMKEIKNTIQGDNEGMVKVKVHSQEPASPIMTESPSVKKTLASLSNFKEHFRKFDTPVGPTDKYVRGRTLELSGFSRENMINPVRKFLKFDNGDGIYKKIAKDTVVFAAACLNDRKNGTLYAGIDLVSEEGQQGQVVGIHLDKSKCENTIHQLIGEAFFEDQQEIVFQAVRSAKFIEVVQSESPYTWVVEIDIVPHGKLVKDEAFFIRGHQLGGKKKKRREELYRLTNGNPQKVSERDIFEYMKKKKDLTELRLQQEFRSSDAYVQPDLRKQILNLYTGGSEGVEDEIYPVLMVSPLDDHMNEDFIQENLDFIQHFDAKVIFDFDSSDDNRGLFNYLSRKEEQVYEVQTTDNFDTALESYSEKNIELLRNSTERSWVFSNGYSPLQQDRMNPFDWKQKRSDGFKEALRFFHTSIPLGRGMVLIFLFSKNYEVLLEASHELIMKFKDQWMVIAETEDIANLWKEEMIRRHVISKQSVKNRCVIGMPWRHVNATFTQIISPRQTIACELPTSTGAFCTLRERDRVEMNDLEILSRSECDGYEELYDSETREGIRRREEESFFRGCQVKWLNFWFRDDHVLKRKQHRELIDLVKKALETSGPEDDERVTFVTLLHQPGAGGTTTSKQILWDLRDKVRCCVVRRITDETAQQITKLRNYDEKSNRKPPLVLVDNEDDDKFGTLMFQLEEKAKVASRNEEPFKVFCTVLHCIRRVNLPSSHLGDKILLKHELLPYELAWFQKKYDTLERKFNEDKKVDPKLLISFNILKTNFDDSYIRRAVHEFMKEIDDTREAQLLKYLSLINSFDADFQTIPFSAFDPILGLQSKQKRILQFGLHEKSGSRGKGWETSMSTSVRVLVNESSQRGSHGTRVKTIRITSALLAKEILAFIVETLTQKISEIIVEFLTSAIFECENSSTFKLTSIVKNLVKKRQKQRNGRSEKFSPLILEINHSEGADKAAEVCEEVYKKTKDPMIAQQIARFYIHTKNWSAAELYAKISTTNLPKNSFLWDTFGQVYKQQLLEKYNIAKSGVKIDHEQASEILRLAQKAIDIFRKEQVLSETEKSMVNNHGGYLGELRVTMMLMNIMCHFENFTDGEDLHNFLVVENFKPQFLQFLDKQEEGMLKSLGDSAFRAIRKLEDELVHLKSDNREELGTRDWSFDKATFVNLKENVNTFFGEDSDVVPGDLTVEDACEYRRRRVRRIGLTSLQGALALKYEEDGEDKLKKVYDLIAENVATEYCTTFDLVTMLNTVVAFHVAGIDTMSIPFPQIIQWSIKLYDAKQPEGRPYLETFLYLVLFNLPTESRRKNGFRLCSEVKIQEALSKWRDAFYIRYPKQRESERLVRSKDTTLFFLGRGVGLKEIVYQKELLISGQRLRDDQYWQSEQAKKRFKRMEGILLVGGQQVQVQLELPGGNKFHITIPTSLQTRKRSMWQKRVYFVLGFSWLGPKAYDITIDDPSDEYGAMGEQGPSISKTSVSRGFTVYKRSLAVIESEMDEVKKELEKLEKKKELTSKDDRRQAGLRRRLGELANAQSELLGTDDSL